MPSNLVYLGIYFSISELYSNSVLATSNFVIGIVTDTLQVDPALSALSYTQVLTTEIIQQLFRYTVATDYINRQLECNVRDLLGESEYANADAPSSALHAP
ncbi:hypothetical protein F5051DRAFT_428045 [Lentinula edodes]|nr:hypothetical protein F5051DRAFT_428045 [Lentinula edodes]